MRYFNWTRRESSAIHVSRDVWQELKAFTVSMASEVAGALPCFGA